MNIEELLELLSRYAEGEDVSIETEVTIRADISVNTDRGARGPIQAMIFFKDKESDDILYSARIEKMRQVQVGPSAFTMKDEPLMVSDLEVIPGIEQESGWTETGHAY